MGMVRATKLMVATQNSGRKRGAPALHFHQVSLHCRWLFGHLLMTPLIRFNCFAVLIPPTCLTAHSFVRPCCCLTVMVCGSCSRSVCVTHELVPDWMLPQETWEL